MSGKAIALALSAAALWSATANAQIADCLAEHEQGQLARRAGQFQRARDSFAACQAQTCPAVVQARCADFARELESAQPSAVVVVSDERGGAVSGAQISTDGGVFVPLSVLALRLDPGSHVFRVQAPGFAPADKTITLSEGFKDMKVFVTLTKPRSWSLSEPSPGAVEPKRSESNTAAWAFAIGGGIAVAGAGALSATGWGIHGQLQGSCGDTAAGCSSSQVEPLRVIWPASFAALGVGVASVLVATILFATHSKSHAPASSTAAWVLAPGGAEVVFP